MSLALEHRVPMRIALRVPDPRSWPRWDAVLDNLQLAHALDSLPDDLLEVLILRLLDGMTFREIGDVIDRTSMTAMLRYRRAVRRIRFRLTGKWEIWD